MMMNRLIVFLSSLALLAACGEGVITPEGDIHDRDLAPPRGSLCGEGTYFDAHAEVCLPVYDEEREDEVDPEEEREPEDEGEDPGEDDDGEEPIEACGEGMRYDEAEERCLPIEAEEPPGEGDGDDEEEEEEEEPEPEYEPHLLYIHVRSPSRSERGGGGDDCIPTATSYSNAPWPGSTTRMGYAAIVDTNLDWSVPREIDCWVNNGTDVSIAYRLNVAYVLNPYNGTPSWDLTGYSEEHDSHYYRSVAVENTSRTHPYEERD